MAGIGNALMAVPMVRQIKRAWPAARMTILARLGAIGDVYRRLPEVDEVLVTSKGIRGKWRDVSATRARKADYYVIPFPSNRWQYALLAMTSGAKQRILHGYPVGFWKAMHFVPATRVPAERKIHDVVQNLNLLRAIGIEPDPTEAPVFLVNDEDRARADELLGPKLARDVRFVAIHAGSEANTLARAKRWPAPNYARLIEAIVRDIGLHVVLLEGPSEQGVSTKITGHLDPAHLDPAVANGGGVTTCHLRGSLGDAAAVLERATLYVGSDSGLAHLAAAVGTRAVTLFAPADPDRVSPFGNREFVVKAPQSCDPCFLYPWDATYPTVRCHEPYCIDSIKLDEVLKTVRRALDGQRSDSLFPVRRGEGRGEGQDAPPVGPRSHLRTAPTVEATGSSTSHAAHPSPPPSPRSTGKRE
ncbi:MAG: glycosyltransferase family 9 protein [Tepidisphaeraceae bacterium]